MPSKSAPILIVGAGVFGLTTALELHSRGYSNITILDRFLAPVPDGSSTDISRIVRADYADAVYAKMASEAQSLWKSKYSAFYHPCGYVAVAPSPTHSYIDRSRATLTKLRLPYEDLGSDAAFKRAYPALHAAAGSFAGLSGYKNDAGAWADAAGSIRELAARCSLAGVSFVTGARGTVMGLRYDEGRTRVMGVDVAQGAPLAAETVIVAAGAWSCRLVDLSLQAVSTCQPLGFIQLDDAEAAAMAASPIVVNLATGWFCFPPEPRSKLFKVARHGFGYMNEVRTGEGAVVSAPLRDANGAAKSYLPADADAALREGLRRFFPKLADRPWQRSRLCWYTDTPNGDFIIDQHPEFEGLFIATGGSGQ